MARQKRVIIRTPFPSLQSVAREFKMTKQEVERIKKIMREIRKVLKAAGYKKKKPI